MTLAINEADVLPKKQKRVMLPILIVLFLISYGLMSMLVVEQGRTIESQRALIHDLFNDSSQLTAMKLKELLRERAAKAQANGASQAGNAASPVTPEIDGSTNNKGAVKPQRPALQKPPRPAADNVDFRRIPLTV